MALSAARILNEIAEALGLPVDHFYGETERFGPPTARVELLRLWDRIETDAGRLGVLAVARKAAAAAN